MVLDRSHHHLLKANLSIQAMQSIYLRSCLVQLCMNTLYTSCSMRNEQVTGVFIN